MVTKEQIINFLKLANQHSWPANIKPVNKLELHDFEESHFCDGEWEYYDLYGGPVTDIGFQLIFYRREQIWGATYRGGAFENSMVSPNDIFSFLIKAFDAPIDMELPLRGPSQFSYENWLYKYRISGDFSSFVAAEHILYKNNLVYERVLSGGLFGKVFYGNSVSIISQLFKK